MTNNDLHTTPPQDHSGEYLNVLFGAHSVTKTVLGYYNLLDDDSDDEIQLIQRMKTVCKQEKINEEPLELLQKIFQAISDFRADREQIITTEQLDSTKNVCQSYVNWVFQTFPCFQKGEDGKYYYHSN